MEAIIKKDQLKEICLSDLKLPFSKKAIQSFTEDINITGYVICKHAKGKLCDLSVSFGSELFCKSEIINSLKENKTPADIID